MPIYEQIPLRLQLSLISAPPVIPVDGNTGLAPKFWRAQALSLQLGIFDAFGAPVDLTNLTQLQFILQKTAADLVPLVVKTVTNADNSWRNTITSLGWAIGTEQNAIFTLTSADTDQSLGGLSSSPYWLVVQGLTSGGVVITYAAGPVTIYNASSALPTIPSGYVSYHAQNSTLSDITVTPTSQLHTEIVTVAGAARTNNIILASSGIVAGAIIELLVNLPATANITQNVKSVTAGGSQLFTLSTNSGVTRALLRAYFDGANWQPLEATLPAY